MKISSVVVATAIFLSGTAVHSQEYIQSGHKWTVTPVVVKVNNGVPSACVTIIQRAINDWNAAGSNFRFSYGGLTTLTTAQGSATSLIVMRKAPQGQDTGVASGVFRPREYTWNGTFNIMKTADIDFDSARFVTGSAASYHCDITDTPYNRVDFYTAAKHELGHALGLAHVSDFYSLMTAYPMNMGEARRTIYPRDVNGAKSLYGPQ